MRKKLLIMALALAAMLGLTTLYAGAASGENTVTLHVGTGQPFETLDAALNHAARDRSADPMEIILQSDTTMNTAQSVTRDMIIKSEGDTPYIVTNTADFTVGSGCTLTLENVTFTSSGGGAFQVNNSTLVTNGAVTLAGNRVVVNAGGNHTMNGGTISNNTAAQNGGGVYMQNGNLNLSGTPVVRGNTQANSTASNFYNTNAYVNVTDSLRNGAEVWVTNHAMENFEFGKGATDTIAAASARCFRNDLYSLTGSANGTSLIWRPIMTELLENSTVHSRYASLNEAISVYTDSDTQFIQLVANITDPSTVN